MADIKIKPCPLCKSCDSLRITTKDAFMRILKSKNCEGSMVSIDCTRCGLELNSYHAETEDDYDVWVKMTVAKWNKLSEKEIEDDGK